MSINVAERHDVKFLERRARIAAAQNAEVLKGIMATNPGRAWMHDHLADCSIGATPFAIDPIQMSFNCGLQSIGLKLWAELQTICPDQYILMMQEHHARDIAATVELARSQDSGGGDQAGWSHHDTTAGDASVERDSA